MRNAHFKFWPSQAMHNLCAPATNMFYNAEVSARRFPNKPFLIYYDTKVSFAEFHNEAERIAGYLEHRCAVRKGDRVLLLMQNSPQFIIGYYGILRANAVVVPLNPMNLTQEILRYAQDAGANTMLVSQELYPRVEPLLKSQELKHVIVAAYSDYLKEATTLAVPEFIPAPRIDYQAPGLSLWKEVLAADLKPGPLTAGPDDLCVMPYTSGTTGKPKGCMHTHRSVMSTLVGCNVWFPGAPDSTHLSVLPMFHVTGMQGGMNGPLYAGATIVILPRWDRDAAAQCMQRYGVTSGQSISTMMVVFLSTAMLGEYDLSKLSGTRGGGAAMPAAIARKLKDLTGLDYVEGYAMSETIAASQ